MEPKVISIIGGRGKMGRIFSEEFKKKGYEVIISGRNTEIDYIEATKRGDVVIISVPIRNTEEIIKKIREHVKEDAMLTDFTSIKVEPCKTMLENSKCEVIGGHPLFGAVEDFKGKNYVLCPIRKGNYFSWFKEFLESLGLNVFEMSPEEHDKNMAVIQCLNHFSNLSFGDFLRKKDFDLDVLEKLMTPAFSLRFNAIGRMLDSDASLYTDIELENSYTKEFVEEYIKSAEELKKAIREKDSEKFEEIFNKTKEYFGGHTKKAKEKSDEMLKS